MATQDIIDDCHNFERDSWAVHKVVERGMAIISALAFFIVAILAATNGVASPEVLTIVSWVFIASTAIYVLGVRSLQTIAEAFIKIKYGVNVELDNKEDKKDG